MKNMRLAVAFGIVLAVTVCGYTQTTTGSEAKVILADELAKGWSAGGFGEIKAVIEKNEQTGKSILQLKVAEESKPWCGGFVTTGAPAGGATVEIALSSDDKKNKFLVMKVNGGLDEWGSHVGGQALQICVGRCVEKGKWIYGSGYLPLSRFIEGGKIDGDPETWQQVKIPLEILLKQNDLPALGCVFLQFQGAPGGTLAIQSMSIE